ncbi:MAG: hypothetical protein QN229_00900 [Desulfurococcaceae archaeon TW002]
MKFLKSWFGKAFTYGFFFGVFLGILSYILRIVVPQASMFSDYILVITYFMCYPIYVAIHKVLLGLGRPKGVSIVYSVSFIMWIATYEIIMRYLVS